MVEKPKELISVMVLGRPIIFKPFNEVQLTMAHRIGKIASAAASSITEADGQPLSESSKRALSAGMDGIGQLLTMIQRLAVDPIDQEWLTEQMLAGELELEHIHQLIDDMTPKTEKEKTPAKKATRAK
jgi:hypothetical protein